MDEMARIRSVEFGDIQFVTEELQIPMDNYGCCVAALVCTEYRRCTVWPNAPCAAVPA